ncbi:MAG: diguanylate cyclase [Rhodocyclales bacterium]|nr:diguanylate cyclase [Rhodocyclales bacterium]
MDQRGGTVLVIDDSPINIRHLYDILGREYEVLASTDGEDGIAIAVSRTPDLILLDVTMPQLDGYEVCTRLKEDPRTCAIPIIFITARDEDDEEAKGLLVGAIDYIVKPVRPSIVLARVRNHIELKRSRDMLERLTTLDPLTGIHNRRSFDDYLEFEWRRCQRESLPISCIIADIDHFKAFNDNHGHPRGDTCLVAVAEALQSVVTRSADLVARYGGEEFACVLPQTGTQGALHVARKMLIGVAGLAIPHRHSADNDVVSVSVGVVTMTPCPGASPVVMIRAADAALYDAKAQGRNRIVVAESR